MSNANPFEWKECANCQETSREERRNLNCTFVRVNFKESCVKTSARMTEIPFSYTRDKASFSFILRKEGISSRRHAVGYEQRRVVAWGKNRQLLIANLRYHLSCTRSSSGPILNFPNCDDRAKNILHGPVEHHHWVVESKRWKMYVNRNEIKNSRMYRSYSWIDI